MSGRQRRARPKPSVSGSTAPRTRRPAAGPRRNLGDGANVGQRVQRHGDVEVIFQLAYELQDLKRIETEVGEQFALEARDRSADG